MSTPWASSSRVVLERVDRLSEALARVDAMDRDLNKLVKSRLVDGRLDQLRELVTKVEP